MTPSVSVIVPAYQAAEYIERCLHSLFRQFLRNIQYIIIDDASTDATPDIIRRIVDLYPHRRSQTIILTNKTNQGIGAVRQAALERATGEFVIHCDADDYFEPEALMMLYIQATTTDADIVICGHFIHHNDKVTEHRYNAIKPSPQRALEDIAAKRLHAAVWNKLIRRDFIRQHGITFPKGLNVCEDLIFSIHALLCQPRIATYPGCLYHYDRDINSKSLSAIDYPHDPEQLCVWINELQRLPLSRHSIIYWTEMTHIAYWALRHDILDPHSYSRFFRPYIHLIRKSRYKMHIRLLTELAARGFSLPRRLFAIIDALHSWRH